MITTCDKLEEIRNIRDQLFKEFEVKNVRKLKYFVVIDAAH